MEDIYRELIQEFPNNLPDIFNFLLVASGARKAYLMENLDGSLADLKKKFVKLAPKFGIECYPEDPGRRFLFYQGKYQKLVDKLKEKHKGYEEILGDLLEFDCPGDLLYAETELVIIVKLFIADEEFMAFVCRKDNFDEAKIVKKVKGYKALADQLGLQIRHFSFTEEPVINLHNYIMKKDYDKIVENHLAFANLYNNFFITQEASAKSIAYRIMVNGKKKEIKDNIKFLQTMFNISTHSPFENVFDPSKDDWDAYDKFLLKMEESLYKFYSGI